MSYSAVLVKLSGEVLGGKTGGGIDPKSLTAAASEIASVAMSGCSIALVIGAGNIFRGRLTESEASPAQISRLTADRMGMLGTVINALAFRDALHSLGASCSILTPGVIAGVSEQFSIELGRARLRTGEIVICAGGTGNPLFTTDTAACLRGIELGVEAVLKATMTDGIYDRDPHRHPDATRFHRISYSELIRRELRVIDLTAVVLCRDHGMPIAVYDMAASGALARIVAGESVGTLVTSNFGQD